MCTDIWGILVGYCRTTSHNACAIYEHTQDLVVHVPKWYSFIFGLHTGVTTIQPDLPRHALCYIHIDDVIPLIEFLRCNSICKGNQAKP